MRYCKVLLMILTMFCIGCQHQVQIRSSRPLKMVKIAGKEVTNVDEKGTVVNVPTGFGPLAYEAIDYDDQKTQGFIARDEINQWALIGSISGAIIAVPAMIFSGLLVANPHWTILNDVNARYNTSNAGFSYMRQNVSPWTIPITAIFALAGTLPLLGLLRSERVANGTVLLQ